jgi:hypothetical protein
VGPTLAKKVELNVKVALKGFSCGARLLPYKYKYKEPQPIEVHDPSNQSTFIFVPSFYLYPKLFPIY